MPTVIRCPSCERRLRIPENLLGKSIRCPACKKMFAAHPEVEAVDEDEDDDEEEEEEEEQPRPARRRPAAAPPKPKAETPPPPSPLGPEQPGDSGVAYKFQPVPDDITKRENEAVKMRRKQMRKEKAMRDRVRAKINGPATALIVFGGLTLTVGIIGLLLNVLNTLGVLPSLSSANAQPQGQDQGGGFGFLFIVLWMVFLAAWLAWGGFTIRAGRKMKELEEYVIVRKWAIMAILPFNPCWFVGVPIGIWVLSVMNDKEVRTIFTKPVRADDSLFR